MKNALPLSLAVSVLALGALIVMQWKLAGSLQDIPKTETHNVRIMGPQEICLTKTWCSTDCGEVVVKTTFREQGHQGESYSEFVARHTSAVAAMMEECPEDC